MKVAEDDAEHNEGDESQEEAVVDADSSDSGVLVNGKEAEEQWDHKLAADMPDAHRNGAVVNQISKQFQLFLVLVAPLNQIERQPG
ncbi:hypothetical protein AKJ16_DCAP04202 [Drosera capensis]